MDRVTRVDGPLEAALAPNGLVVLMAGEPGEAQVLVMQPDDALETARRLIDAVRLPADPAADFVDNLDSMTILAPVHGAPGRLVIRGDARSVTFTMGWTDLIALAASATEALKTAAPDGQS